MQLFYGEREAVQILKDENREILEIIHRYNYFYTEPPLSDVEDSSTDDSEVKYTPTQVANSCIISTLAVESEFIFRRSSFWILVWDRSQAPNP